MKNQSVMLGFLQKMTLKISIIKLLMLILMLTKSIKVKLSANKRMKVIKILSGAIKKTKLKKEKF